jgi:hypothetical protein
MVDIVEPNDEISSVLERAWEEVAVFWLAFCSGCGLGGTEKNKHLIYLSPSNYRLMRHLSYTMLHFVHVYTVHHFHFHFIDPTGALNINRNLTL